MTVAPFPTRPTMTAIEKAFYQSISYARRAIDDLEVAGAVAFLPSTTNDRRDACTDKALAEIGRLRSHMDVVSSLLGVNGVGPDGDAA